MIDTSRLREQSDEELEKLATRKLSADEAQAVARGACSTIPYALHGCLRDLTKKAEAQQRATQTQQQTPPPVAQGCNAMIILIVVCIIVLGVITTF
jgi:hypothetical protein